MQLTLQILPEVALEITTKYIGDLRCFLDSIFSRRDADTWFVDYFKECCKSGETFLVEVVIIFIFRKIYINTLILDYEVVLKLHQ